MDTYKHIFYKKADSVYIRRESKEFDGDMICQVNNSYFVNAEVWANNAAKKKGINVCDLEITNNGYDIACPKIDFDDSCAIDDRYIYDLAQTLKKLHSIRTSKFGPINGAKNNALQGLHNKWEHYLSLNLGIHLDYLEDNGSINLLQSKEIFYYIGDGCSNDFEDYSDSRLLHGDLNDKNIKYKDGKLYLIDWEDAICGDPAYDLAYWATSHSDEQRKLLWKTYFGEYGGPNDYYFWIYYLRISVMKLVVLHKLGYKDLRKGQNRIKRALKELKK